jgi:Cof subfamily protein (haloacid dehalogenase superfamily)
MPFDLLVLDLDGTLLSAGPDLDPIYVKALHQAMERGLLVTLATGRMPRAAAPYVAELRITAPVILYNGALVRDPLTGRNLFSVELPPGLLWAAYQGFARAPVHPLFYRDDSLYCLELTEPVLAYCRERRVAAQPIGDPRSFLRGAFVKGVFLGQPADLQLLRNDLAARLGSEARLVNSSPRHLELLPVGASKGAALRSLAEHLGLFLSRVVAVGDEENDLEMLKEAGLGIAMAHAPEEVRAAADRVAPSTEAGGLLALLAELCPERFG